MNRYLKLNRLQKSHYLYLLVGGAAFVADNGLFAVLLKVFNVDLVIATALAMLMGFLISFYGNKLLVFHSKTNPNKHSSHRQLTYYVLLLVFNTTASYIFIRALSNVFDYPIVLKTIAAVTIVAWNFTIYKKLIFLKQN